MIAGSTSLDIDRWADHYHSTTCTTFDLETHEWKELDCKGTFLPRIHHAAAWCQGSRPSFILSFFLEVVCLDSLYVFGGEDKSRCLSICQRYEPRTKAWQTMSSMNVARSLISHAAVTSNGKIYVSGGSLCEGDDIGIWTESGEPLKSCEVYDPQSNSWTLMKQSMIHARKGHAMCAVLTGSFATLPFLSFFEFICTGHRSYSFHFRM